MANIKPPLSSTPHYMSFTSCEHNGKACLLNIVKGTKFEEGFLKFISKVNTLDISFERFDIYIPKIINLSLIDDNYVHNRVVIDNVSKNKEMTSVSWRFNEKSNIEIMQTLNENIKVFEFNKKNELIYPISQAELDELKSKMKDTKSDSSDDSVAIIEMESKIIGVDKGIEKGDETVVRTQQVNNMKEEKEQSNNFIEKPNHYRWIKGIECKDVAANFSCFIGSAIKYLWRHGKKLYHGFTMAESAIIDLLKAKEDINVEMHHLDKDGTMLNKIQKELGIKKTYTIDEVLEIVNTANWSDLPEAPKELSALLEDYK